MKRFFGLLILTLACYAAPARAWNCDNPLDARVDVGTTKPSGTSGDGDGQYFLGTGTEGTKGHYYVCETPKSSNPKNGTKQKQQQNQNQQQNQTANGGSSTAKSSVNSSNTNTNNTSSNSSSNSNSNSTSTSNAQGGSATNNGNSSNNSNYSSTTNVDAARIPVNTAYAPTTVPTMSCFKTYSGGAQTVPFGISVGGGKVDDNCRKLETAMHATNQLVYCKIYITTKDAKAAGVTLEDCLGPKPEVPVVVPTPVAVIPPVVVTAPEPTPAITTTATQTRSFPDCSVPNGSVLTNICKAELRDAARAMVGNPGAVLHIAAPQSVVSAVKGFLRSLGVQHGVEWGIFDGQNNNLSFYLTWTEDVR
jgi:hypothetical protein